MNSITGCLVIALLLFLPAVITAQDSPGTQTIERVSPEAAKAAHESGDALLVCAYDDQRCSELMIEGAITSSALAGKRSSLDKTQEIIFYCA